MKRMKVKFIHHGVEWDDVNTEREMRIYRKSVVTYSKIYLGIILE
jgi:hypothetical protein